MSARDMTDETLCAELERGAQNCGVAWTGLAALLREAATRISSPPADLPATLASVDDVRRVCEAAELSTRIDATYWTDGDLAVIARAPDGPDSWDGWHLLDERGVLAWFPFRASAVSLFAAIQATRSTS